MLFATWYFAPREVDDRRLGTVRLPLRHVAIRMVRPLRVVVL